MREKFEFPKTLPWQHVTSKGEYALIESIVNDKGVYTFYEKDIGFGFSHALEIETVFLKSNPKELVRVKTLASTCQMSNKVPKQYLICREDYFLNLEDAIGHLKGETRIYKPKRKPEIIREMTEQQIKEYWRLK